MSNPTNQNSWEPDYSQTKETKEPTLEDRPMVKIKIGKYGGWCCEFPITDGSQCNIDARQWKLKPENALFHLCREHGEQMIRLFNCRSRHHGVTVIGGYDEPENMNTPGKIQERWRFSGADNEAQVAAISDILFYLMNKEEDEKAKK